MQFTNKRVVVPVRGGHASEEAFRVACLIAHRSKAKVYALYAIEVPYHLPLDAEMTEALARAENIFSSLEHIAKDEHVSLETQVVQTRHKGPAIVEEVKERGADLIVLGIDYSPLNGRDPSSSAVSYILRHSPCPVLVLRDGVPIAPSTRKPVDESSPVSRA